VGALPQQASSTLDSGTEFRASPKA
jgi:hypothetical protein